MDRSHMDRKSIQQRLHAIIPDAWHRRRMTNDPDWRAPLGGHRA
jgi:hypothetical protein